MSGEHAGSVSRRLVLALFAIDVRSLAALRVVLAVAVLSRLIDVTPHYVAFFSDDGILPRRLLFEHTPSSLTSLYFLNGEPAYALVLLLIHFATALALLVGYRTRLATVACWVLNVSLAVRNPYITTGGDLLTSLLLFWAMFLPMNRTFAVDAALADEKPPQDRHISIATAGLLLQAMYVYFFGALLKTGPEWTLNGSAVYAALHLETTATHLAHWLRQHTALTYVLTVFVYWIELLSPVLLFSPVRTALVRILVLPFYMLMHVGFRLFLSISNFWLASIASLCAFIPSQAWDAIGRRYWRDEQRAIIIRYDGACGFCRRTALLLREFFLPHEVRVTPAEGDFKALLDREQSWIVTDHRGRNYLHWDALVFVCSQSLAARPIGWLLWLYGAIGLGLPTYRLIGRNRHRLSLLTPRAAGPRPALRLSPLTQTVLGLILVFCLFWNVREVRGSPPLAPLLEAPAALARSAGLLQRWTMFAPMPQLSYAVPVIEGELQDGRRIDALNRRLEPPSYTWPRYPIDAVRSAPWRKYFNSIGVHSPDHAERYFGGYATFICNSWNRSHHHGAAMQRVTVTLLIGRTLSGGRSDRSIRRAYAYQCPAARPRDPVASFMAASESDFL